MATARKYTRGNKTPVPISTGRGKKAAVVEEKPALDITILRETPAVPPTIQSERQKSVWTATCGALIERELLSITDLAVLEAYVMAHATYLEIRDAVQIEGHVVEDIQSGNMRPNPLRKALQEEFNNSLRLSKELGLTPRSRVTLELNRIKKRNAAMLARGGEDQEQGGIDGHLGAF